MKLDFAENSIIGWLLKYGIKTESGEPFDLRTHAFWFDILTDWSPNIVLLKAAQVGGTTALAIKLLWAMKKYGLNCAYTMPTADDVKQFVGGRLNALIRQNSVLDGWIEDKDSVEQKRIGDNIVYFRGTMTERAALSFPADLIVYDEEDRSNKTIISQYASRQQHSKYKWQWHLSNPSTPGNGVSAHWEKSDKKHWFITCQACQAEQFLSWPDSIDPERGCYQCKVCHAELTEDARRKGRWVKTAEGEVSGYWVSLLMAPWVSARDILKLHKEKSPEYFYNFVLGLPYAGSGNVLLEQDFFANLQPALLKYDDPIVVGADSGLPNWYVIGNKEGLFFHSQCNGWEEIKAVMRRFPKAILVGDQGGDLYGIRELAEELPGRVYLCWFRQDRKSMEIVTWGKDKDSGAVFVDRNRAIQQMMDEFRTRRLPIFGTREDWQLPWQHFAAMYKFQQVDEETGEVKWEWRRSGADHLALSTLYYRVGMTKFESGDGSRYVRAMSKLEEFFPVKVAPVALGDGTMLMPKPNPLSNKDWRDIY